MNDIFILSPSGRISSLMDSARRFSNRLQTVVPFAIAALWLAGCGSSDAVRVKLHTRPSTSGALTRLEIQAQVAGPQTGLRYKWFAVSGGCDPQDSDSPTTVFQFAENVT